VAKAQQKRATASELARIAELIDGMSLDSAVYRLLRDKLTELGYWRAKPRGNPQLGLTRQQAGANTELAMHNYAEIDQD